MIGNAIRRVLVLAAAAIATVWQPQAAAHAEWSATLPAFKACHPASTPSMPDRWHAVGLMMPFLQGQLDVGEFKYDGPAAAMRATVYGLESGAVDLLITGHGTYVLEGPHRAPTHCTALNAELRPPSPQWLSNDAVCVGEAPLAGKPVQWWEKPGFDVARYWYATDSRLPWRTLFLRRTLDPTIVGDYAMTYFPEFTPLDHTDLSNLEKLCAGATKPIKPETFGPTPTARELMTLHTNPAADAEREKRIAALVPGLTHKACARQKPAQWPDRFVMTAVITPTQLDKPPSPALIYYDWKGAQTLLVLPFRGYPPSPQAALWLKPRLGYGMSMTRSSATPPVCRSNLPGIVRPDWIKSAGCTCKGVVAANSPLAPHAETQIFSCPIKHQEPRIMWTWYTTDDRPILFMEAHPWGIGVMLADYDDWVPGQTGQAKDFQLPPICKVPDKGSAAANGTPTFSNVSCADCHSTPW